MFRPISTLDIPEFVKLKLFDMGYEFCEDLQRDIKDGKIVKSVSKLIEAFKVEEELDVKTRIISGVELWQKECINATLSLFHKGLDKLLGGGLPLTRITELCGAPGAGKTQICLQLCIDVQIPRALGGAESQAVYITTDNSFRCQRLRDMATSCVDHCHKVVDSQPQLKKAVNQFSVDSLMKGIFIFNVFGHETLLKTLKNLSNFLKINYKVKLIIVDSFSFPFILQNMDTLNRTRLIYESLDALMNCALEYKAAVVLTNQLTTLILPNSDSKLIPALGESFFHRVHYRLMLGDKKILLMKSLNKEQSSVGFEITQSGVR